MPCFSVMSTNSKTGNSVPLVVCLLKHISIERVNPNGESKKEQEAKKKEQEALEGLFKADGKLKVLAINIEALATEHSQQKIFKSYRTSIHT